MRSRKLPRPGRKGLQALTLLLLLILNDWVVAAELQSHHVFAAWLAGIPSVSGIMRILDLFFGAVELILAAWYLPVILAAMTAIFWLRDTRRFLLLPLIVFTAWSTFIAVLSLIVVAVTLLNPNTQAEILLTDTFVLWISNTMVFAAWYWIIDDDAQQQYSADKPVRLNFLFAQTGYEMVAWSEWKPGVLDYLFLSFIIMAQFGPSDTVPLTRLAKVVVMIQTVFAMITITLIASRAIGIVK
jgi:hypothetical protein